MKHRSGWLLVVSLASAAACGGKAGSEGNSPVPSDDDPRPVKVALPSFPTPNERPDPLPLPDVSAPPEPVPDPPPMADYGTAKGLVLAILATYCGDCHGRSDPTQPRGELEFTDDIDYMVEIGLIVPLRSDQSPVFTMMRDGSMPPPGTEPRPPPGDITVIGQFIDNPRFWPVYQDATPDAGSDEPPGAVDAGLDGG